MLDLKPEEQNFAVAPDLMMRLQAVLGDKLDQIYIRGNGCEKCNYDGNIGLTVAAEVVELDHEMLRFLRQGEKLRARQIWKGKPGSKSYVDHALEKVAAGIVDPADAETRLGVPLDYGQTFYVETDV